MVAASSHILVVWATPHPFPLNIYFGTLAGGLGCFPFEHGPYHPQSDSQVKLMAFGVCLNSVTREGPSPNSALPPIIILRLALKLFRREPAPSSIGISPLPTVHPLTFQRKSVRSSIQCYLNFNLTWVDHLVSGLRPHTQRPIQTRFRCGSTFLLNLASDRNSPVHSTKARHHPLTGSDYL